MRDRIAWNLGVRHLFIIMTLAACAMALYVRDYGHRVLWPLATFVLFVWGARLRPSPWYHVVFACAAVMGLVALGLLAFDLGPNVPIISVLRTWGVAGEAVLSVLIYTLVAFGIVQSANAIRSRMLMPALLALVPLACLVAIAVFCFGNLMRTARELWTTRPPARIVAGSRDTCRSPDVPLCSGDSAEVRRYAANHRASRNRS